MWYVREQASRSCRAPQNALTYTDDTSRLAAIITFVERAQTTVRGILLYAAQRLTADDVGSVHAPYKDFYRIMRVPGCVALVLRQSCESQDLLPNTLLFRRMEHLVMLRAVCLHHKMPWRSLTSPRELDSWSAYNCALQSVIATE